MLSKDQAIAETKKLQSFLQKALPETGVYSVESANNFVKPFDRVTQAIADDDFNNPNVIGVFGKWRVLADHFGVSEDDPIMGPYRKMSRTILEYLKQSSPEQ